MLMSRGVKRNILQKNKTIHATVPPPPPPPLLLTLLPPPPPFTMPRFLINFCGVWNPLGAISHFSKHPGSFLGEWSEGDGELFEGRASNFHFYWRQTEGGFEWGELGLSVQSDGKKKECHRVSQGVGWWGGTLMTKYAEEKGGYWV